MEMTEGDEFLEDSLFCPRCKLALYPTDDRNLFFLLICRGCGYQHQLDFECSWENHKVNPLSRLAPKEEEEEEEEEEEGNELPREDETWAQKDMAAMRKNLLNLIHRYYLETISRLPTANLQTTIARGLVVAGHCYGPLHPLHNILVNSIWYVSAFPLRAADQIDVKVISNDGIVRTCHRSLDGLVASLRHFCPSLSTGDALWNLMGADADLSVAVAMANRTSKPSARAAMRSQANAAFQVAAKAARHPNPAALGLFASSLSPTVERDVVQFLRVTHILSPMDIKHLTESLVPDLPSDLLQPPLMISPKVCDAIISHKKMFKHTEKAVLEVVTVALCKYMVQSGEQFVLHSVCGVNVLNEESLDNCYHINFFAHRKVSGPALIAPLLFFTEAIVSALDEDNIRLCVVVDPLTEIGVALLARLTKRRLCTLPIMNTLVAAAFKWMKWATAVILLNPLDVDYIFFDAERDRAFADLLDGMTTCDSGVPPDVLGGLRAISLQENKP